MSTHQITISGVKTFEAEDGAKLAYAIEQSGYDISHRCGGNARCTTCRVQILGEDPPMGPKEHECLVEDGVLGEFRLSCQIRVDRDMEVIVLMPVHQQEWEDAGADLESEFEEGYGN